MTVIPIIIGALGKVTKVLVPELEELKIRELLKTIQTTARILRRVLEIWVNLLSLKLQWKTIC